MGLELTTRRRWLVAAAVTLLLSGCGSDADAASPLTADESADSTSDAGAEEAAPTSTTVDSLEGEPAPKLTADQWALELEAVLKGAQLMEQAYSEADPVVDVTALDEALERMRTVISDLLLGLPDPDGIELEPGASSAFEDMVGVLEQWEAGLTEAAQILDADRARFQEANDEWLDGPRDDPPPADFLALIDAMFRGFDTYSGVCTTLSVELEIASSCAGPRPPLEPTDIGVIDLNPLGDFRGTIDLGSLVEPPVKNPAGLNVDLASSVSFLLLTDVFVADPTDDVTVPSIVIDENFAPVDEYVLVLERAIFGDSESSFATPNFPDDLLAWAEAMPVEITASDVATLGSVEWTSVQLASAADEPVLTVVVDSQLHPEHGVILRPGGLVRIWEADFGEQKIVGVLTIDNAGADAELYIERSEEILASITPS